jgi:hypothetical protein
MRFRAGLVIGFAAGFYVGAMAGRERYEDINRLVRQAKGSDVLDTATGTAKTALGPTFERAKGVARGRFGKAVSGDGAGAGTGAEPPPSTAHRGMTGPPEGAGAAPPLGSTEPANGQPLA